MPWSAVPLLCAAIVLLPTASAHAWTERELMVGDLSGTLTLPMPGARGPAALIWPGSGPVDRDGNLPEARPDMLKLLAHRLAEAGVASLRVDKRGIGASKGAVAREDDLTFDKSIADAVAWTDRLRQEPEIEEVALIGHSEGALVATMAAQQRDVSALVLVAGASEPAPAIIARQLEMAGAPETLRRASARIAAQIAAGQTVDPVPADLAALYRPSVQPYLASWFAFDPADELASTTAPVLVIQGTTDLQTTVDDAHRLAASRSGIELAILSGMNHVLRTAPSERSANLATYSDPTLPLAPALAETIAAFLRAR